MKDTADIDPIVAGCIPAAKPAQKPVAGMYLFGSAAGMIPSGSGTTGTQNGRVLSNLFQHV